MDKLIKVVFRNIPVRLILVDLSNSWQEIQLNNSNSSNAFDILGQALAGCSLLISNIKFDGSVSLQIRSNGNLSLLLAECTNKFGVRGIVNLENNTNFNIKDTISSDAHFVVNILPNDKNLNSYQGIIPLYVSNNGFDMAMAISQYMQMSEQIETRIWLASNEKRCVGILLQKIPSEGGYSEEIEEDWSTIYQLANTIKNTEMLDWDLITIVNQIFNEYVEQDKVVILEEHNMSFYCTCSNEKAQNALKIAINDGMDREYFEQNSPIKVGCEFCNKSYTFDTLDYDRIKSSMSN